MKKYISLFLVLTMMLSLVVPALALAGQGTAANPYLVSSAADLCRIHDDLDGYYKLTADINMAGVAFDPIGNETEGPFTGTIDGAGHTVRNLNLDLPISKYVGLVGYLEGTVKDLTLKDVSANGYHYVGGIAGYAAEGSGLSGCTVSGTVIGTVKISSIYPYIGGIVGYNGGSVSDCTNNANTSGISISNSFGYYSAGIVGYNSGSVSNCTNSGDVVGWVSGGIVGHNAYGSVSDCTNNGGVSGISDTSNCGGIVGESYGNINNCTNTGNITAGSEAGGIAANVYDGSVSYCTNRGSITCTHRGDTGGIVGHINYSGDTCNNCINVGNIRGLCYTGGIVGRAGSPTNINNCMNSGFVYDGYNGDAYAGGIIGYIDGIHDTLVKDCINQGIVWSYGGSTSGVWHGTKYDNVGSIAGASSHSNYAHLINCINSGALSAHYFDYTRISDIGASTVSTSFSLAESQKNVTQLSGISVSLSRFNSADSFEGLDFENVWCIDPSTNGGFPQLRDLPEHLQLSECFMELTGSQTKKLTAIWQGSPCAVTWSSDDETVAKVATDGTVTAVGIGVCTVTAAKADGQKANCCVRVYGQAASMTLSDTVITLAAGSSQTLTCIQSPVTADETVWWTSDDEDVAAVNAMTGAVTAKKIGTTTVTATLLESGKSATCQVTVVPAAVSSISLSSTTASMKVGENKTLTATVSPTVYAGSLTWQSSNEAVATVDGGMITAKAPGTAVISVAADSGASVTCTVTVTQPATAISFEKTSITLTKGMTEQLVLHIEPLNATDTISYSTSSNTYVSVSNTGVVTANKAGTATITATASSGQKAYCTVTVVNPTVPVTSVTLGEDEFIMTRAETRQLTASVLPSGATNKTLTWTSSNEDVAEVNNTGVVTAVGEGVTVIRAESDNGMYDECVVSVISASGPSVVLNATPGAPGMTTEVTASMVKNPGISAYRFTMDYDAAVLTPVAIIPNEDFGGTFETNLDEEGRTELNVLWYAEEDVATNGELFTVEFAVVEEATINSTSQVSLTCDPQDICNVAGEHVALYQQGAEIAIAAPLWGDVNGDGALTVYDLTLLVRYVTRLETFTQRQTEIADICTGDGIDIRDVVKLAQQLVKSKVSVPLQLFAAKPSLGASMPIVTVGTSVVNASGEAQIPVSISNNPGISGFRYVIEYNSDAVEILSITPNVTLASHFTTNLGANEEGQVIVTWYDTENMTLNGELFSITARVKSSESLNTAIVIQQTENNMCNENLVSVTASYEGGGLIYEEPISGGDINGDGAVNAEDLQLLSRHVAKIQLITDNEIFAKTDYNQDGIINAKDMTELATYIQKNAA